MTQRLKTVPLKEFFGDPNDKPGRFRTCILVYALAELAVLAVLVWKLW